MKTASITQAKNQLSALLDAVRAGETILILDRNRPVARLEPIAEVTGMEADGRLARLERGGLLRRGSGQLPKLVGAERSRPAKGAGVLHALLTERDEGR